MVIDRDPREQNKPLYNQDKIDDLFKLLYKDKGKLYSKKLKKDKKYVRYNYTFSREDGTKQSIPISDNTFDRSVEKKGSPENMAAKEVARTLDKIMPTLDNWGHSNLVSINFLKHIGKNKNSIISINCHEESLNIPANKISDINSKDIETVIYKGVIKEAYRRVSISDGISVSLNPKYTEYIDKYIQKNDAYKESYKKLTNLYKTGISNSHINIYKNPQQLKKENPYEYMALGILFSAYNIKSIEEDQRKEEIKKAERAKKIERIKEALTILFFEDPKTTPKTRDKNAFTIYAEASRNVSEKGNPGSYTFELKMSDDGKISGTGTPSRNVAEDGNPGVYTFTDCKISKSNNNVAIKLKAKASNFTSEPGNPSHYDIKLNIDKNGKISGTGIPERKVVEDGNPGKYTFEGEIDKYGNLEIDASAKNGTSQKGNPGDYKIEETLPQSVSKKIQEFLK